jgi:purine-nucleoside phosphorylase
MNDDYKAMIKEASDFIKAKSTIVPEYGLILGSGLGELANEVEDKVVLPYKDIPNFVVSTAPSHAGNLVIGKLSGKNVAVMQGRAHIYEGYSPKEVSLPVRVMNQLGVKNLLVTCATGGLNRNFKAGDLMLITDHINLSGFNPLTGPNDPEIGVRFPVMFDAYNPKLRDIVKKVALENKIYLHEGVYLGIAGPVFFTRAELRYAIGMGADAIGMSVVQEVIAAIHSGMKVLGIGNITDMALPDLEHHATEKEVLEIANRTGPVFRKLLKSILAEME